MGIKEFYEVNFEVLAFRGSQIDIVCPYCKIRDLTVASVNVENGIGSCKSCGETWNMVKLKMKCNINDVGSVNKKYGDLKKWIGVFNVRSKHEINVNTAIKFGMYVSTLKKNGNIEDCVLFFSYLNCLGEKQVKYLRMSADKDRKDRVKWLHKKGNKAGWFLTNYELSSRNLFIVAGEWDVQALYTCTKIIGISATNGESQTVLPPKSVFSEKIVYIIYDNDKAGRAGAEKLRGKILELGEAKEVYVIDLGGELKKGKDLEDYFEAQNDVKSFFKMIYSQASMQSNIARKKIYFEEDDDVEYKARRIVNYLLRSGTFIDDGKSIYYFSYLKREVVSILSVEFSSHVFLLSRVTKVNNKLYSYFEQYLLCFVKGRGRILQVFNYSFFCEKSGILYLHVENNKVLKIAPTGKHISVINNGEESVFFTKNCYSFDVEKVLTENMKYKGKLMTLFLDQFSINKQTSDENESFCMKLLVHCWFLGLCFKDMIKEYPILYICGEQSSGKSYLLRLYMRILFGDNDDLYTLPSKEKDFWVLINDNYVTLFDNVDNIGRKVKEWFFDNLAAVVTGVTHGKRTLFKDSAITKFRQNAAIAINGRKIVLIRPDITDRTVLIEVNPIKDFVSSMILEKRFKDNINEIRGDIIVELVQMVKSYSEHKDDELKEFNRFRCASFSRFLAASRYKIKDFLLKGLDLVIYRQGMSTVEDTPLMKALSLYFEEYDEINCTTVELYEMLKKLVPDEEFYKNARSFGMVFRHHLASFRKMYKKVEVGNYVAGKRMLLIVK